MEDIDLARSLLEEDKWNLVIVKKGQVLFSSRERGIAPFFQAVQSIGKGLHNAAVADRIVGLAVAMLCLHARVSYVYAGIVSQGALDMLRKKGVAVDSKTQCLTSPTTMAQTCVLSRNWQRVARSLLNCWQR